VRPGRNGMASWLSQRHKVVSPIDATIPRRTASCRISGMLRRESGRPCSCGTSQASSLIVTAMEVGKADRMFPTSPFRLRVHQYDHSNIKQLRYRGIQVSGCANQRGV
jgi:hypothetical protein